MDEQGRPSGSSIHDGSGTHTPTSPEVQTDQLREAVRPVLQIARDRLLSHTGSRPIGPELWQYLDSREHPDTGEQETYTRDLWRAPLDEKTVQFLIPDPEDYTPEQLLVLQQFSSPDRREDLEQLLEVVFQDPRPGLFYGFTALEASSQSGREVVASWEALHGAERDIFSRILEDFDKIHRHFRRDYQAIIPPKVREIGQKRAEALLAGAIQLIQNPHLVETLYPGALDRELVQEYGSKRGLLLATLVGEAFDALEDLMLPGEGFAGWDMQKVARFAERMPPDSPLQAAIQTFAEAAWLDSQYWQGEGQWQQRQFDKEEHVPSAEETKQFYQAFTEMDERATETTGDTEREQARLFSFADKLEVKGNILDAGSGTGERITEPFTKHVREKDPATRVVGIDLQKLKRQEGQRAEYVVGNIAALPFRERSFDSIISTWSVINDLTERDEQLAVLAEFSRTLKEGGLLYLDVPFLEGGPGSWEEAAEEYQKSGKKTGQPFGTIVASFPQGGRIVTKHFYMYPQLELVTALQGAGFRIENAPTAEQIQQIRNLETFGRDDPMESPLWRTRPSRAVPTGRPRWTIIARKVSSPTGLPFVRRLESKGQ